MFWGVDWVETLYEHYVENGKTRERLQHKNNQNNISSRTNVKTSDNNANTNENLMKNGDGDGRHRTSTTSTSNMFTALLSKFHSNSISSYQHFSSSTSLDIDNQGGNSSNGAVNNRESHQGEK